MFGFRAKLVEQLDRPEPQALEGLAVCDTDPRCAEGELPYDRASSLGEPSASMQEMIRQMLEKKG